MLRRGLIVAGVAVLVLGIWAGALGQEDPFASLSGPVAKVETWAYKAGEETGGSVGVWAAHEAVTYDGDGNPVESLTYAEDGSIEHRYVRSYDEGGRLLQVETYGGEGELEATSSYAYEDGVRVESFYDASGNLQRTVRYELDADGNIVRATREGQNPGEVESYWESTYTPDEEPLTLRMYDEKGELSFAIDYRYDADGYDVVSTFTLYVLGAEFMKTESGTIIAEADAHGNWTEKRVYDHTDISGEMTWTLAETHHRVITYRE